VRFDSKGDEVEIQSEYMEELIIFSKRAHAAQDKQSECCAVGDSRSLVIDSEPQGKLLLVFTERHNSYDIVDRDATISSY
jgi:hypothetical protein